MLEFLFNVYRTPSLCVPMQIKEATERERMSLCFLPVLLCTLIPNRKLVAADDILSGKFGRVTASYKWNEN